MTDQERFALLMQMMLKLARACIGLRRVVYTLALHLPLEAREALLESDKETSSALDEFAELAEKFRTD